MKRIAVSLLSILMVTLSFAACTNDGNHSVAQGNEQDGTGSAGSEANANGSADGKQEISMWFFGALDEYREVLQKFLVEPFEENNPGYKLVIEYRHSVDDDLATALMANQGPDILYGSSPATAMNFILADKYADLTPYAEQYGWQDKMIDSFYDVLCVDGKMYNIACGMLLSGVAYREDVLAENGWETPGTIDELTDIMDEALEKGMPYGGLAGNKGWQPCNEDYATLFMTSFGGADEVYKCLTGEQSWNNEAIRYAVDTSAEWLEKGYLEGGDYTNLDQLDCAQLMYDKKAPFFFGPSRFYQAASGQFPDSGEMLKFMAMPSGRDSSEATYAIGTTGILGINANSDFKDQAAAVLDIIMQEKFVANVSQEWPGYWAVPLKGLADIDVSKFSGMGYGFMDSIKTAVNSIEKEEIGYYVSSFYPPETYNAFVNIDSVWYGDISSEKFLNDIDKIFEKEAEKGLVPSTPKKHI